MVPSGDPKNGPKGSEPEAVELDSKEKKKARVAVSIQKGTLLFFPTAPALMEKSSERRSGRPETGPLDED